MYELGRDPVQVMVPVESRSDVSKHGFCKQRTTAMFEIRIINLNMVSYLHMMLGKALANADTYRKYKYLPYFLDSRHAFTPMVYSVGRFLIAGDLVVHSRLASLLSFKVKH